MTNLRPAPRSRRVKAGTDSGRIETRGHRHDPRGRTPRPSRTALLLSSSARSSATGTCSSGRCPSRSGSGGGARSASVTIGAVVGSLVFLGVTPVSPKTGTNTQVSSGARSGSAAGSSAPGSPGSSPSGFFIILDLHVRPGVIYTFNRWFGTRPGLGALSVGMLAVLIVTCLGAVLGHRTLERASAVINVASIIILVMRLVGVFATSST